ncbi:corrinoid protein [Archaeoglobus fulgidus]|uniref:Corrinoid methyltransferase protein (MtaC-1) n=3 Tax=Archaeoglobus fulgidus TaxID=2234 RepID=O30229_ARCFU|nr:corrinoid protein [Archaeoglobus fulgidus]AAB91221.1 corrinoid methyltransferase protein (mtaC-1) [Archaeoglobus fulgidus DSM 4304]AIG96850.1 putative cobalamin binding protein [Archaeoglobus fulgidus DSM 8774]
MADVRKEFVQALADLDEAKTVELTKKRVESGEDPFTILEDVRKATDIIGKRFEEGRYFVSDLIMAGEILKQVMEILRPLLGEKKAESKGKVVIGTVEGDVHDIGKNIVIALLEAEGFEVVDIGVDQPPEAFVEAANQHNPDVVGLSGLLTEAIESMKRTVEALRKAGYKGKIIIGGGRTSEEAKEYTGADDWADDAAVGVRKIKALVGVE